ncbi:unnamed protein product [Ectocarpus sp. CCAP 1310/34]|nr:unnamed protein product [Ectocarpus sp. CCAP 1310/34]
MPGNDGLLVRGGGGGGGGGVASPAPLGAVLFLTACFSAVVEQRTTAGSLVGAPLLSFGIFCVLSNLNLVPATHSVYDLCWSFLLPLSLSTMILGIRVVAVGEERRPDLNLLGETSGERSSWQGLAGPMGRVGLSFLIGAVGSIAGVAASFRVATTSGGWAVSLPRGTAAQLAGVITASYIGGSVNLFAVASFVGMVGVKLAGGSSLLGALAAADIFLMSVYFSFLVAAHKAPFLCRVFPGPGAPSSAVLQQPDGIGEANQPNAVAATPGWRELFGSTAANISTLLTIGSAICFFGNAVARRSPLPGTSTMAITLLTVGATRVLTRLAPGFQARLSRTAPFVATLLLNVFFCSVGASGRWVEVVSVAPAIFMFAALALAVHIAVMAAGAAVLNRFFGAGLGLDDITVASNANIGGPSTAATFAGLLGKDDLVVPAAVWGTVGYAIATTLGVGVWTILR